MSSRTNGEDKLAIFAKFSKVPQMIDDDFVRKCISPAGTFLVFAWNTFCLQIEQQKSELSLGATPPYSLA